MIPAPTPEQAQYIKITSHEAQLMMADDVLILDVRNQDEFDEGHIANAVLLPYTEIRGKAESVIPDKNQTILVYCRAGRRSEIAARQLLEMGYTNVYDFGGIQDWTGEIIE
jgi:rhodanese-related sulfurtransferase